MTRPTASRPGFDPIAMPPRPADSDDVARAAGPPAGASSLADLIADAGPLPPDAALECVQRLAELFARRPHLAASSLDASQVLIDDDGEVWLQGEATATLPRDDSQETGEHPEVVADGMNRLGRLLIGLASGELPTGDDLPDATDVAALPSPLGTVAARLFSRNGACYGSYAELASDAAALRGVTSAAVAPSDAVPASSDDETEHVEPLAETADRVDDAQTTGSGGLLFLILLVAAIAIGVAWWLLQ